jgi:hypothetical protein
MNRAEKFNFNTNKINKQKSHPHPPKAQTQFTVTVEGLDSQKITLEFSNKPTILQVKEELERTEGLSTVTLFSSQCMRPLQDNILVQSNAPLTYVIEANRIDAYIQDPKSEFKLKDILSEFVTRDFKETDLERMEKSCIEKLNTLSNTAPVGTKRKRTPANNSPSFKNLTLLLSIIVHLIHQGDSTKQSKKHKETCKKDIKIYHPADLFKTIGAALKNESFDPKMLIEFLYLMFKNSNSGVINIYREDYIYSRYWVNLRSREHYWNQLASTLQSSELKAELSRYESTINLLIDSIINSSLFDFIDTLQDRPFTKTVEKEIWDLFKRNKNFNHFVKLEENQYSLIVKDKTKDKTIEKLSRENLIKELKRIAMEPINWDASNTQQVFSPDEIAMLQKILIINAPK